MQRLKKEDGTGTELYIGTPKTSSSVRAIPIPSFLRDLIAKQTQNRADYFLSGSQVAVVEPRVMQYRFQQYLRQADIEKANFHALRHTFATRCVECGFEVKSLSEILGHANVQTTLNKYVHSSFALKQENMERLTLLL